MKALFRLFAILVVIIFIIGSFLIIYYLLFLLPENLFEVLNLSGEQLEIVKKTIFPATLMIIVELALAFIIIGFLIGSNRKNMSADIVYVEKLIEKEQEIEQKNIVQEKKYDEAQILNIKKNIESQKGKVAKIETALLELCTYLEAGAGAFFVRKDIDNQRFIEFVAGYAFQIPDSQVLRYEFGEGIVGQVAKSGKELNLANVPSNYLQVFSGLGKANPNHLLVLPIKNEQNEVKSVIEIASFIPFTENDISFAKKITETLNFF
ncbi:MAG: GAF domain-containing protein [Bacteroidetes bacterium]|nr:MAG: GAF domain-containing protein [Bacteroidota bacterium]